MLSEMEKANKRAVAQAQREQRQAQAFRRRAFERELVREEQAMARAQKREEREQERRALADRRTRAALSKQAEKAAAKEAQLREWQLEFEQCDEREREIDRIGNDSPEVEDRVQMYAELGERRSFVAEPFVPPAPVHSHNQVHAIQTNAASAMNNVLVGFRPDVKTIRTVQAIAAGLTALGLLLAVVVAPLGALLLLGGVGTIVIGQVVAANSIDRQRRSHSETMRHQIDMRARADLTALEQSDRQRSEAAVAFAQREYGATLQRSRVEFEQQETARLAALSELHQGNVLRMKEVVETALDLELPIACTPAFTIRSAEAVAIEIDVPTQDALPKEEAKLLASGKVSYKAKSDKKLREQYQRFVAGVALRYASETMLHLPTCAQVHVSVMVTDLDPSAGRTDRRSLLVVTYDFATLAPMTMDGIDPVAALKRFPHQLTLDRKINDIGRVLAP